MFVKKTITIFIGSLLTGIGINIFLVPHKLLEGGAVGISLVFHYLFGVKVGIVFLLLSIPIFIMAWIFYRSFFYNGIHGMLLFSIIVDILYPLHVFGEKLSIDPLVSAALGGFFIGAGVGIMLLLDISNGGLDLLAQMLARRLTLNTGLVIFGLDVMIVSIGSLLIPSSHILYSYVTIIFVGVTTSFIVSIKNQHIMDAERG